VPGTAPPRSLVCVVRRYLRFSLSYRHLEELLLERDLPADHATIWRCVQRYQPAGPVPAPSPGLVLESGTTPTTDCTRSCCSRVTRNGDPDFECHCRAGALTVYNHGMHNSMVGPLVGALVFVITFLALRNRL
jgi:hypothetical protein